MHQSYNIQLTPSLQTYDKVASNALVATIRMLLDLRPNIKVIIAGAIRNADTFESFRQACCECKRTFRTRSTADTHSTKPIRCRRNSVRGKAYPQTESSLLREGCSLQNSVDYRSY